MITVYLCDECHQVLSDHEDGYYYCTNENCDMYDKLVNEDDEE
ncbi:MAG: hypothetical protein ACREBB_11800 [Nitrosotalea sp.]